MEQAFLDAYAEKGAQTFFYKNSRATSGSYLYVVGAVRNTGTGYDWKVLKLDAALTVVWSAAYNGSASADDRAESVKVDAQGNVYVTGWATATGEGRNFVTRKYNSSGTLQWSSTLHEQADDQALTLELDNTGSMLVSGSSYKHGNLDYLTVKYKSTNGSEIWRARFNSDFNDDDIPSNIALDEAGNIYVTGTVGKGDGTTTYYMMCKYVVRTVYMPATTDEFNPSGYIQNRGQLRSTNGSTETGIRFYCSSSIPSTYISDNQISYLLAHTDPSSTDSLHRVDMKFNKGTGNAKTFGFGEQRPYLNFYLGYMERSAPRTTIFDAVVKLGVYSNTDVIFTNSKMGYRHYIIARTGSPTGDFEMQYDGQTSLTVDANGALVIETTLGNLVQPKAKDYTMNLTSGALTLLNWQPDYSIVSGNKVSLTSLGNWSGNLVIEMRQGTLGGGEYPAIANLLWSTYVGDNQGDQYDGVTVWNDLQYACGATESLNFPTTFGAFQNTVIADRNPAWTRYNEDHVMGYGTYYGGTAYEGGAQDICVHNGKVRIVGFTNASNLWIEQIAGADNDDTMGGLLDAFVACFNENGFPT